MPPIMGEHELLVELRAYAGKAVAEIDKLRKTNVELRAEIEELKTSSGTGSVADSLSLSGAESSEELINKIQGFMASIDAYLEVPTAE